MSNPLIEYLNFRPVKKSGSLIGFIGFRYDKTLTFCDVAVHRLLKPKGNILVRIRYPERIFPSSKEAQVVIDEEINAYIRANYKESLL